VPVTQADGGDELGELWLSDGEELRQVVPAVHFEGTGVHAQVVDREELGNCLHRVHGNWVKPSQYGKILNCKRE
jgi:hypothetical protein